jgi:HEAT repeat protein
MIKKPIVIVILLIMLFIPVVLLFSGDTIQDIIIDLYSTKPETRIKGIDKLGDNRNKVWAMERLVQILLISDDEDMRIKACEIITSRIEEETIPALTYKIDDPNIFVRLCCVKGLSKFITDYPIDKLIERLKVEDNDIYGVNEGYYEVNLTSHYNVRREIVKTLTNLTRRWKKVTIRDRVINVFKEQYWVEDDWGVKVEILDGIYELDNDIGFEFLKEALRSENELYVIEYIKQKLWKIGRGAFVDKILGERGIQSNTIVFDGEVRELTAEEMITHIRLNKLEYIDMLINDEIPRNRIEAVRRLSQIADSEIVDIIERAFNTDPNIDVRRECVIALGKCGNENTPNHLITAYYRDENAMLRYDIVKTLSDLGVTRSEY